MTPCRRRTWATMDPKLLALFVAVVLHATNGQLIEGLLKVLIDGENQISREPPDAQFLESEYDFIVVGAGTAGCVLANRLTENPSWKVLLIEAGTHENFMMDIPMLANYLQFTENNWRYLTQPSGNFCIGMDNNRCHFPRGKVMGGSSVLNYMLYSRGHHRDYDGWAEMGNTGWSYEEVLPYFKKVEDFRIPEMFNSTYHSKGGYLSVSNPPYHTKIASSLIKAGKEIGWNYVDYNGRKMVGISYSQASLRNGVRDSSSRAYLHPIKDRKNLTVKKMTQVSRVLIDPKTKTAYGVELNTRGRRGPYQILARKEVILSAGAIGSPQILMLSGVGPRNHLTQKGIPVIQNLKVGYNLMDHIACGGITFLVNDSISLTTDRMFTLENLREYLHKRDGPISVPGGLEACSFHDTENPDDPEGYPNMELFYLGGSMVSDLTLHKNFGIRTQLFEEVYGPIKGRDSFMIFPMILRPKSRGRIMLKDNNHRSKPLIYPNYFSDLDDMDVMIKGIKLMLNITGQPAMKEIGTTLYTKPIPKCAVFGFGSDNYWDCMARHFTFTIYHQSGTCKMGPKSDRGAVVNPRLQVYGVNRLRVADASIIPKIMAAHTNAPTYMIAEKAADLIKEDHQNDV